MLETIIGFDESAASVLMAQRDPLLYDVFLWFTTLGNWWVVLLILLLIIFVLEERHRNWRLAALIFGFFGTQATVFFVKHIVGRERPGVIEEGVIQNLSTTASFPSGHAATAIAFYGLLLYLILIKEKNKYMKVGYYVSGVTFILLIGFSRLYIGVHYVSDVLAGYLVGGVFLVLSLAIARKRIPESWKRLIKQFSQKFHSNAKSEKE